MKLFQIEEPEGSPVDANAAGAAIGIALCGRTAEVAVAVGGNAEALPAEGVVLRSSKGFPHSLDVPPARAAEGDWQRLFEAARSLAERTLARPVTHAVIALRSAPDAAFEERLFRAARGAGLAPLRLVCGLSAEEAAILAEDLAPRPS